jgi:hypothetical protein
MQTQTKIIQGIPFLVDTVTQNIYAYEKLQTQPHLHLGTYNAEKETYTLRTDWREAYQPRLDAHRQSEKPRSRIPVTPTPAQ